MSIEEKKKRLKYLKELEQELTDEQGYWGSSDILKEIEELEESLGRLVNIYE